MTGEDVRGVGGWLLIYVLGSIPLLIVDSMGLSGWFFEYPVVLMLGIFVVLAFPLVLILLKSPRAPKWNVALLWIAFALMTLRSLSVILFPGGGQPPMTGEELLGVLPPLSFIVSVSLGWAIVWTRYFKKSVRVRNTFGE